MTRHCWLAAVLLMGCATTDDGRPSVLCTESMYRAYERAGMPWDSCEKDRQIFMDYFFKGRTWADLDEDFAEFAKPRLKKLARRRQMEAQK